MRPCIGLDASLAETAICVIREQGQIVKKAQPASAPEALVTRIGGPDGAVAAIGFEARLLSHRLHHGLSNAGPDVVRMATLQLKGALIALPINTDGVHAEGIARLLHLGWFRPVHGKSVSAQEVRAVPAARKAVPQGMIALEMPLRGLLRNFGLTGGALSRGRFGLRIRELP